MQSAASSVWFRWWKSQTRRAQRSMLTADRIANSAGMWPLSRFMPRGGRLEAQWHEQVTTSAQGHGTCFGLDRRFMKPTRIAALVLAWVAVVSAGFGGLLRYKAAPGESHRPPLRWPRDSR